MKLLKLLFLASISITFSCEPALEESSIQGRQQISIDTLGGKMKYLPGEDGGGWFMIAKHDKLKGFLIKRFYEDKTFYGEGYYKTNHTFDINSNYTIIPICHSEICTVVQNGKKITFKKVD